LMIQNRELNELRKRAREFINAVRAAR